jgi:hypothetical protein
MIPAWIAPAGFALVLLLLLWGWTRGEQVRESTRSRMRRALGVNERDEREHVSWRVQEHPESKPAETTTCAFCGRVPEDREEHELERERRLRR